MLSTVESFQKTRVLIILVLAVVLVSVSLSLIPKSHSTTTLSLWTFSPLKFISSRERNGDTNDQKLFDAIDTNHDSLISAEEYLDLEDKVLNNFVTRNAGVGSEVFPQFEKLDTDDNEYLSFDELQTYLRAHPKLHEDIETYSPLIFWL